MAQQICMDNIKSGPQGSRQSKSIKLAIKAYQSKPFNQRGWKSRSGKKRLNSIKMPAVMVNQTAAKTGAVVRNFFMAFEGGTTIKK